MPATTDCYGGATVDLLGSGRELSGGRSDAARNVLEWAD